MARTKPIGVRFDPDKLEFIKTREKLESNQQVVDLLVNQYWWQWKMPIATHKEAPPLNLKTETTGSAIEKTVPTKPPKSFLQYQQEKLELENDEQYKIWLQDVTADPYLSSRQKSLLKSTN